MLRRKYLVSVFVLIMCLSTLTGCMTYNDNGALTGQWAYNHDPKTAIIQLADGGKAVYNNKNYTYTMDDTFITLTDKSGSTIRMRYVITSDGFDLYQTTTYRYTSEGTPDGILGSWFCDETNESFEFTVNGTFNEDGYFPGYYSVDEEASSIYLVYNDHFLDTILYYHLNGDEMVIDYPWPMVRKQ